jgi:hypothetical protein
MIISFHLVRKRRGHGRHGHDRVSHDSGRYRDHVAGNCAVESHRVRLRIRHVGGDHGWRVPQKRTSSVQRSERLVKLKPSMRSG